MQGQLSELTVNMVNTDTMQGPCSEQTDKKVQTVMMCIRKQGLLKCMVGSTNQQLEGADRLGNGPYKKVTVPFFYHLWKKVTVPFFRRDENEDRF